MKSHYMRFGGVLLWTVLVALVSLPLQAKPSFEQYVQSLKQEALAKGYDDKLVEQAFSNVKLRKKVIKADKNQPEKKMTLDTYLATRVPDWKVQKALTLLDENSALLDRVERQYGV